jgi:filamentous hemagglutinin family protein
MVSGISTRWHWLLGIAMGGAFPFSANCAFAQSNIIPDNTLGAENSNVIRNVNELPMEVINGGAIREQNLFHSFQEFNVSEGRGAYFFSPNTAIQNILARVTGRNRSEILGVLGTIGNSNPNLFFINPNGIIFGPNARLDVGGSFVATTANGVQFGTQGVFSTSNPEIPSSLLTINPSALLFNQIAASIQNNSRSPASNGSPLRESAFGLRVPDDRSLLLVGGDMSMTGGGLNAFGGRVELALLASSGTVGLSVNENNLSLNVPGDLARGNLSLTNGAQIDVSDRGQGSVTINARNIEMLGASNIFAGIKSGLQAVGSPSQDITIDGTGVVKMTQDSRINNLVEPGSTGDAGNINIKASRVEITGGQVRTRTLGNGNAGHINIKAGEIFIDNPAYDTRNVARPEFDDKPALDASNYSRDRFVVGTGRSGNVSLEATSGSITLIGQGRQQENKVISTYGAGGSSQGGGNVSLKANGSISLSNAFIVTSTFSRNAGAGDISLQGDESISLADNSALVATSFGRGLSGNITLHSNGPVSLQTSMVSTNIGSTDPRYPPAQGNAGDIDIFGRSVSVIDGGLVTSRSITSGNSGNIKIDAQEFVELSGQGPFPVPEGYRLQNVVYSSLTTSSDNSRARGPGGSIEITTGTLRLSDGANIRSDTKSAFDGGSITVNADVVELTGGGQIFTTTSNSGNAGTINVNATNRVTISGTNLNFQEIFERVVAQRGQRGAADALGSLYPESGIFASTSETSTGRGGNVEITSGRLLVRDRGQVSVSSSQRQAGNLNITARSVFLDNQGQLRAETASGEGGNINLQVRDLILMRRQSQISAKASNDAKGGNITIYSPNGFTIAVSDENSDIIASAEEGQGGEIRTTSAGVYGFERSPSPTLSDINASSQAGPQLNGIVVINTPDVDPSQGLVELPVVVANVSEPINTGCAAFSNSKGNEFIVTGRGGLPLSPDEPLSMDVVWDDTRLPNVTPQQRSPKPTTKSPSKSDFVKINPAIGWVFDSKGEVTLISHTPNSILTESTSASCP